MADEVQQIEAELREASAEIEDLKAQLDVLPADAPAAKREYLEQSIIALRTEKQQLRRKEELLLQRLPPIQGMGLVGNISSISQARLGCWRSPGRIRRQVVCSVQSACWERVVQHRQLSLATPVPL